VGVANCDAVHSKTFVVKGSDLYWFLTMQRTCLIAISFNFYCLEMVGLGHKRINNKKIKSAISAQLCLLVWLREQFK
jgi:hypothetical protein